MKVPKKVPKLQIAAFVMPHHGNTFVEEWIDYSFASGAILDAFSETHLIEWPEGYAMKETPAQARYMDIEHEIIDITLEVVKPLIAETFVRVATEVLKRERERT